VWLEHIDLLTCLKGSSRNRETLSHRAEVPVAAVSIAGAGLPTASNSISVNEESSGAGRRERCEEKNEDGRTEASLPTEGEEEDREEREGAELPGDWDGSKERSC